jgi:diacylglycerol kinase family enzyme
MRVALLHNESSGSEDHTDRELTEMLEGAGHEVLAVVTRLGELTRLLQDDRCDLVVVAGGDGTVGRTACALANWGVPLSIFPLGTANNTALSLGLPAAAKRAAKGWHVGTRVPYDLGLISDGACRVRFAEAVGWGLFAQVITVAKRRGAEPTVERKLKRDRKLFRKLAETLPATDYEVSIDGRDLSGRYVLVEVVNVPYIGPRLRLSPSSDPGDGWFELVLATEEQRSHLAELGRTGLLDTQGLIVERGKHVRVTSRDAVLHHDGRLWRHPQGPRSFEISVEPQPIQYVR